MARLSARRTPHAQVSNLKSTDIESGCTGTVTVFNEQQTQTVKAPGNDTICLDLAHLQSRL
ncbi:hypothetical protein H6F71_12895 [Microcoleus sp. FACHB-61]|nr:hypothetical protein [Microcoleus sp. FACHB-61]